MRSYVAIYGSVYNSHVQTGNQENRMVPVPSLEDEGSSLQPADSPDWGDEAYQILPVPVQAIIIQL